MANSLTIECADRSVRWYLTPGQTSRYEILVINQSSDERVECAMSLDDPPQAGSFEPASFALRPRERKTVALTFNEEAQVPRDQRALVSVRDPDGIVIASLEHALISAGGIDCTIQLSWKEPILDGDDVRGFVVSCAIKSLSASPGEFGLQFTPHPSLEFVDVTSVKLQPGQTATVAVPILWQRAVKDADGNNHPRAIEIGVAVSQGKRTGRLQWDTVDARLAALAKTLETVAPPTAPAPPPPPVQPPAANEVAPLLTPSAAAPTPTDNGTYQAPLFELPSAATPPAAAAASSALAISRPVSPIVSLAAASAAAVSPPPAPAAPQPTAPTIPPPSTPATTPATAPTAPAERVGPTPPVIARVDVQPQAQDQAQQPSAQSQAEVQASTSAPQAQKAKPVAPTPDFERPEDDEALMSLLVGKPVAPPAGWRGPDTPPVPPPSIYARTPPSVVAPPPRPAPPEPTPPASAPQPFRRAPAAPIAPAAQASAAQAVDQGVEVAETPPEADQLEALEASIVGPPPSLARAVESSREMAAANARRTVDYIEPMPGPNESKVPTFVIGGTALLALLLAGFLIFRPHEAPPTAQPQAVPTVTVPPAVMLQTPVPAPSRAGANIGASPGVNASNRPAAPPTAAASAASRVAAQATQRAVSATAPASAPRPVSQPAAVAFAPKPVHRPASRPTHRPIPPSKNTIVAMVQGVDAHYGPQGHAVRVVWGANGQASAHVSLQDDKGSVLSETDVAGTRQSALLYVPRTYHGSVFVQVISQGALGERVTQSTQLPPFSR
jgi:hypothetical protein